MLFRLGKKVELSFNSTVNETYRKLRKVRVFKTFIIIVKSRKVAWWQRKSKQTLKKCEAILTLMTAVLMKRCLPEISSNQDCVS